MANDIRIPPAVSLAFERVAYQVCVFAKLDYDDWYLHVHELRTHLQERWKEGIEIGLSTDKAEEHALAMFGNPRAIAKSLRKPWLVRLLNYKRFRSERLLTFLAAYVFFSWMQVLDVHYRHYLDSNSLDPDTIMLPFSLEFFTDGLGTFFVGILTVLSVGVIQWEPMFANAKWNQFFLIRHILMVVIVFSTFELAVKPCVLTLQTFQNYDSDLSYQGYCVLHLLGVVFGWLGVACLASELFGLPAKLRNQRPDAGPLKAT